MVERLIIDLGEAATLREIPLEDRPLEAYGKVLLTDGGDLAAATLDGSKSGPDGHESYHS